jgi:hypothetical protein
MMKKITLLFVLLFAIVTAFAQDNADDGSVTVIQCSSFGISRPLSELMDKDDVTESTELRQVPDREHRTAQKFVYSVADGPEYGNDPSTIQTESGNRMPVTVLTNWAGQGGNSCPLDPSGAVGPNHYVQSVNANPFKIFNKTTGVQMGTVRQINNLWSPAAPLCCDPIILYDKYADRWVITALQNSGTTLYIAVSTTNDPTGTYYTYTFTGGSGYYDYPKMSIWADGYYMTFNAQSRMFCFERDRMIVGDATARLIYRTFTPGNGSYSGFWAAIPADADGQLPPLGSPFPFFSYSENAWGSGNVDGVKIWTMAVTWGTTPAATVTQLPTIPTAAFDASYNSSWYDVPQPSVSNRLDGLGGVCMYRAQWRKWVGYNSVVLNWGVKITENPRKRGIKWVELRQDQTTGTWSLFQEGIYNPFTTASVWMGSIAMDDNGSISLCYAKSDSTGGVFPSLAFTGRLKTDAPGTMSFAETIATAGTSAQPSSPCGNRFGDYAQTALDPNGLTFWHTGMYISAGEKTRIYSFQLPLPVSVEENAANSSFTVYQVGELLNVKGIEMLSKKEMVVDLFDRTGRMIKGSTVNPSSQKIETTIDVAGLAKGTYMVRIGNADFQKVVKVAVN